MSAPTSSDIAEKVAGISVKELEPWTFVEGDEEVKYLEPAEAYSPTDIEENDEIGYKGYLFLDGDY